ncbi:MAG TPA: hypothetical protein VGR21_05860 [Cryptosporangiaceae bacterium]|nr:hypothetical protein [Cryptosporangiaceae bacterium]
MPEDQRAAGIEGAVDRRVAMTRATQRLVIHTISLRNEQPGVRQHRRRRPQRVRPARSHRLGHRHPRKQQRRVRRLRAAMGLTGVLNGEKKWASALTDEGRSQMDSPELNFLAAVGIGLVIGVVGGFVLKGRRANAMWLAPVLALSGSLVASVLALIFGDDRQYGWKELTLQIVLAGAGVGLAYVLGAGRGAGAETAAS